MKISRFEDIIAWQKAKILTLEIHSIFSKIQDYSFRDQIWRASISIMNNIAEGFERNTDKEFKYFLYVSKGSCGEVRSMLILAKDLGLVSDEKYQELYSLTIDISRLIAGFIKSLN